MLLFCNLVATSVLIEVNKEEKINYYKKYEVVDVVSKPLKRSPVKIFLYLYTLFPK